MSKEFEIFLGYADDAEDQVKIIKELESEIDGYIKDVANGFSESRTFTNCKFFEWRENVALSIGGQKIKIDPFIKNADLAIFIFKSRIGKTTKKEVELARSFGKNVICMFPNKNIYAELMNNGFDDFTLLSEIKSYKESLTINWNIDKSDSITPLQEYDNKILKDIILENVKKVIMDFYQNTTEIKRIEPNEVEKENDKVNLHIHSKIPPRDAKFIDREEDIKDIICSIKNNSECMVYSLKGLGGIGKSAITTEICHIFKSTWDGNVDKKYLKDILGKEKYFKDGILWIKFEQDISFERHIEILSESINYKLELKDTLDELKNKIENIFYKNDILIVLDSAEQNKDNFIKFYNLFFGIKPIIITTREKFDFIDNIKNLNKLNLSDSRELFIKYLSSTQLEDKEIELIDAICLEIDYLPLAIIIMSKMADELGLKSVKDDVSQKLTFKRQILEDGKLKSISIEDVFDLSYQPLSKEEKRILSVASIFNYPFTIESLEKVLNDNKISIHLNSLVNKSLIDKEFDGNGGFLFIFHPLMRSFALNYFEKLKDKKSLNKAKEIYYYNLVKLKKTDLKKHIKEVFIVLKHCTDNYTYLNFVMQLNWWLSANRLFNDREKLLKSAINKATDDEQINYFKLSLGYSYSDQHKFSKSNELFNEALEYYTEEKDFYNYLTIKNMLNNNKFMENDVKYSFTNSLKLLRIALFYSCREWYINSCDLLFDIGNVYHFNSLNEFVKPITFFKINNESSQNETSQNENSFGLLHNIMNDLINKEEYSKVKSLINLSHEIFPEKNRSHLISLKEIRINIEESESFDYTKLIKQLDEIEIILLKNGDFAHTSHICYLKGKLEFKNDNFSEAKKYFKKIINDETLKNFWLGKCELEEKNLIKSKEYFINTKEILLKQYNFYEIAYPDMFIAYIESFSDIKKANDLLSRCKKIFDLDKFVPKDYYKIIKKIENLKVDTSNVIIDNLEFFLEDIPHILKNEDNEEMILIKKGISFYGKGNSKVLTIDNVYDNIDKIYKEEAFLSNFEDNIFLYDFYIDKECVSNRSYIKYLEESNKNIPINLSKLDKCMLDNPVELRDINDAKAYAKFYNKEIPLPQEWEKVFRGVKGCLYFKDSSNYSILKSYKQFELTHKKKFENNEKRFKNSSDSYCLTDSFSLKEAGKKFIFRCVKPVYEYDDIKEFTSN